jgi:hypothetical protein
MVPRYVLQLLFSEITKLLKTQKSIKLEEKIRTYLDP